MEHGFRFAPPKRSDDVDGDDNGIGIAGTRLLHKKVKVFVCRGKILDGDNK